MAPAKVTEVSPVTNGSMNGVKVSDVNGHGSSYAAKHNLAAHFIGGNHLEAADQGPVKDFVAAHDGHTVITSVRQCQCT